MGNSTVTLQDIIDAVAVRGSVNPEANPAGYSLATCLAIGNDTMDDLVARRFNFKWNSALAPTFLTNRYQQDYPQLALSGVGWLENSWAIDVNSSTVPRPFAPMQVDRDLSPTATYSDVPAAISWMYNKQLQTGQWPGAAKVYAPLLGTAAAPTNGPMAITDANGNILLLTTFGMTGLAAPVAPAGSVEGVTVQDGTAVWTVCSRDGQGFRLDILPSGRTWQIAVKYQQQAVKFTSLLQTIDPVPDDQAANFRRGYNAASHDYSPDPNAQKAYPQLRQIWLESMADETAAGDREPDSYMLVPATQVVDSGFGIRRNPRDPGTPY